MRSRCDIQPHKTLHVVRFFVPLPHLRQAKKNPDGVGVFRHAGLA
jgi:hypothetical protein